MHRRRVIISLSFLLVAVACAHGLYLAAAGPQQERAGSLTTNLRMSSNAIVGICVYYVLCKLACAYKGCRPLSRQQGPRGGSSRYQDASHHANDARTEVHRGVPRLTMQHVWVLVYGLGGVLFVTSFCLLSLHPVSCACLSAGLHFVAAVEMSKIPEPLTCGRVCNKVVVLTLSVVACVLSTAAHWNTHPDEALTPSYLFYYVLLPFLAPLILTLVKAQTDYSVGLVTETCEFGLPFALILAVQFLLASTAEGPGPRHANLSHHHAFHRSNGTLAAAAASLRAQTTTPASLAAQTTTPASLAAQTTTPASLAAQTTTPATTLTTPQQTTSTQLAQDTPVPPLITHLVFNTTPPPSNASARRTQQQAEQEQDPQQPAPLLGTTRADAVMLFCEPLAMGATLVLFVAAVMHSHAVDNIVVVGLAVGSKILVQALNERGGCEEDERTCTVNYLVGINSFVVAGVAFVLHLVTTLNEADDADECDRGRRQAEGHEEELARV
jgi:hypothetical protein